MSPKKVDKRYNVCTTIPNEKLKYDVNKHTSAKRWKIWPLFWDIISYFDIKNLNGVIL